MDSKKRNKNLIFKVNEDEWNIIQKRLEVCKVSSMSELFRQMMLHGIYLEYDHEELKKIRQSVASVANNINQIARSVNAGIATREDVQEATELLGRVYEQLYELGRR